MKRLKLSKKHLIYLGIIVFASITILPSMYFYFDAQKAKQEAALAKSNPSNEELRNILEKVDKLVLLPEGENPTLATVTDKQLLSGQSFYANAENGDKVLIYANARKAFLYRPSINKLIEIAPIIIDPKTATTSAKP